jgi:glucoamylase
MRTWAGITWSGPAIWWKLRSVSWLPVHNSDAVRVLRYLESTQEADGYWAQNMWLDGRPYWMGLQMDETAFPILLVDALRREAPKEAGDLRRWWKLVHRAAGFLARNGPVTQ